ncbi:MAG: hypothetical protein N2738_03210 [Thermodesulfovibrionales bacterium]|nr:hypothetical protein [Thermodesulfovibrionales bacterium]
MKKILFVGYILTLLFFMSCKDKAIENPPIPQVPLQQTPQKQTPPSDTTMVSPHGNIKKTEKKIEVPDSVKAKWTKAVIIVEDSQSKTKYEQTVSIGSEFVIKNSNIVVKTREFLPDFKMTDSTITTASSLSLIHI